MAYALGDRLFAHAKVSFYESHLTESVYKVVLQKSVPTQTRQLIVYYY